MRMNLLFWLSLFLVGISALEADCQTFEVQVTQVVANGADTVSFEIRRTGATAFVLATTTLVLNYNTAALGLPALDFNYSGPWDFETDHDYFNVTQSGGVPGDGFAGLLVEFVGGTLSGRDNNGFPVPTTFRRIGALVFPVTNPTLSPGFSWRVVGSVTQAFRLTSPGAIGGGQTIITGGGTFISPDNTPLPIQLSAFTATVVSGSQVRLNWTTVSETNNYGFEVQKSEGNQSNYQTIPNSFVAGHGTTNEPHSYSFVDNTASTGTWFYRLRQIDLDGAAHFTEGIQVDVLTGVNEKPLPKEFALDQNYPNPFNPSTNIEYAVPRESRVQLEVYNVLGQRVATLVDEVKSAGYYTASFNAASFSSGFYFYRMNAGEVSFLRKMMLVR